MVDIIHITSITLFEIVNIACELEVHLVQFPSWYKAVSCSIPDTGQHQFEHVPSPRDRGLSPRRGSMFSFRTPSLAISSSFDLSL